MRLIVACALLLALVSSASANPWQSDEEIRLAKLAERKAEGRAVVRFACVLAGAVFVWVAVGTARHGLGIGPAARRVRGQPAAVAGALIAAMGLAVAVGGWRYAPRWLGLT